jgi:aminopeptidase YwaD
MNTGTHRWLLLAAAFLLCLHISRGQDIIYARSVISRLTSPGFEGRGYVKHGDRKAAKFISGEFKKSGLKHYGKDYFQPFNISINTFPGKVILTLNGQQLVPGTEFLVASSSPSLKGTYKVVWANPDTSSLSSSQKSKQAWIYKDDFVITQGDIKKLSLDDPFQSTGLIIPVKSGDNLWWHVSNGKVVQKHMLLLVRSQFLDSNTNELYINARNKFLPAYETRNVIGYIAGKDRPDSFFVFTAHYDHLGKMGRIYFPGANDNASGTAMLMDLARYYAQSSHRPRYTIVFIATAAEEVGLLGAGYFTDHPLFPLEKIKFLINLDMVGTGSDGITVVNGSVYEKDFNLLQKINAEKKYVKDIAARGESCNSDHCPFYQKGVPSFFIYTRGEDFKEYHNVNDRADALPLTAYQSLVELLTDFTAAKQ